MRRGAGTTLLAAGGLGLLALVARASPRAEARVSSPRTPSPKPATARPEASTPAASAHAPLPGHPKTGSAYGWRTDPITGQRAFHRGLDIPVPVGTPVYAPLGATVERVDRDGVGKGAVNGNAVILRIDRYRWAFLHLSSVAVRPGATVQKGQLLGRTGQTGRATGPHLHIQVYDPAGKLVDPLTVYPANTFTRRAP